MAVVTRWHWVERMKPEVEFNTKSVDCILYFGAAVPSVSDHQLSNILTLSEAKLRNDFALWTLCDG